MNSNLFAGMSPSHQKQWRWEKKIEMDYPLQARHLASSIADKLARPSSSLSRESAVQSKDSGFHSRTNSVRGSQDLLSVRGSQEFSSVRASQESLRYCNSFLVNCGISLSRLQNQVPILIIISPPQSWER